MEDGRSKKHESENGDEKLEEKNRCEQF